MSMYISLEEMPKNAIADFSDNFFFAFFLKLYETLVIKLRCITLINYNALFIKLRVFLLSILETFKFAFFDFK